jgi:hypothetical protein
VIGPRAKSYEHDAGGICRSYEAHRVDDVFDRFHWIHLILLPARPRRTVAETTEIEAQHAYTLRSPAPRHLDPQTSRPCVWKNSSIQEHDCWHRSELGVLRLGDDPEEALGSDPYSPLDHAATGS